MTTIINTSDLQKMTWDISKNISTNNYIVTNRWRWKLRILPYFDWSESYVNDYLEAFKNSKNYEK